MKETVMSKKRLGPGAKEAPPRTVDETITAVQSGELTSDEALEAESERPRGERKGVMEFLDGGDE